MTENCSNLQSVPGNKLWSRSNKSRLDYIVYYLSSVLLFCSSILLFYSTRFSRLFFAEGNYSHPNTSVFVVEWSLISLVQMLKQQADIACEYRLQRKCYTVWRQRLTERSVEHEKTTLALLQWSLVLQRKVGIWLSLWERDSPRSSGASHSRWYIMHLLMDTERLLCIEYNGQFSNGVIKTLP